MKGSLFIQVALGSVLGAMGAAAATTRGTLKAPDFAISASPGAGSNSVVITATAPQAHHFNIDAPMSLEAEPGHLRIKPERAGEREVLFKVPASRPEDLTISIFLCDDAKTFCERHSVHARWDGKVLHAAAGGVASALPSLADAATPRSQVLIGTDAHGFILNQPERAFERARRQRRPLLIEFYGIWCPPCNQLDEDVFSSREFGRETGGFVKLKMDGDAPGTRTLFLKYKIMGFPTVVFASPDGEEVTRITGYRPKEEFLEDARRAWRRREQTSALLARRAGEGDRRASDRLGLIELDRGEYARALRYLKGTRRYREKRWDAEIGFWDERKRSGVAGAEQRKIQALEQAIAAYPATPDSIERRSELADAYNQARRPGAPGQWRALIATARELIGHPGRLKGHDMTVGDLWETIADAQEKLGQGDEAKKTWKKAAERYQRQATSDSERGYNLELAFCLRKAGDIEKADELYGRLEKAYPSEFTFYFDHARMDFELARLAAAHDLALKAWGNSYGDNRLDSATLLAKICRAQGNPKEALSVVHGALAGSPAPEDEDASERTLKRVKALQDLEKKLRLD